MCHTICYLNRSHSKLCWHMYGLKQYSACSACEATITSTTCQLHLVVAFTYQQRIVQQQLYICTGGSLGLQRPAPNPLAKARSSDAAQALPPRPPQSIINHQGQHIFHFTRVRMLPSSIRNACLVSIFCHMSGPLHAGAGVVAVSFLVCMIVFDFLQNTLTVTNICRCVVFGRNWHVAFMK